MLLFIRLKCKHTVLSIHVCGPFWTLPRVMCGLPFAPPVTSRQWSVHRSPDPAWLPDTNTKTSRHGESFVVCPPLQVFPRTDHGRTDEVLRNAPFLLFWSDLVEGLLLCCSSNKENVKLKYYWLLKNGSKFIVVNSQQSARYAHSHMHILFPRPPWLLSAREKWTFATIQTRSNRRIILLSHETGANERIQSNLSPSTCKSAIASAQAAAATRIN